MTFLARRPWVSQTHDGAIAGLETDNVVQPVPSSETGINPP